MLPDALGESFLTIVLASTAALGLFWIWRVLEGNLRLLAWTLAGIAAMPALAFGLLYLFGIPIVLAALAIGVAISFSRSLEHLPAVACGAGWVSTAVLTGFRDSGAADRLGIILFLASIFLALLVLMKLGRVLGEWLQHGRLTV